MKLSRIGSFVLAVFILTIYSVAAIRVVQLDGPVDQIRAQHVINAIGQAEPDRCSLILLEIDTPGGLGSSMKDIIGSILNAPVPVLVYVTPRGAHAASAGFFILVAADVAAMAEGTNTGAAHPLLALGGIFPLPEDEKTRPLLEKVQNDMRAYLRSIVNQRGRNVEAAVAAVDENASYTAGEAREKNLIELIAKDRDDLLRQLNGRKVKLFGGRETTLQTTGQAVEMVEMSLREKLLAALSSPDLAVLLALAGVLGLFFEFSHPGFIAPGVIGGICLILSVLGFSFLPVNYVGVILIIMAIAFFIAEIKVQGFGVLGAGGIVCLVLGFMMLIDSPDPGLSINPGIIWGIVLPVGAIILFLTRLVIKAMQQRPATGPQALAIERGTVITELNPHGRIFIHGEYWEAESVSGETIPVHSTVEVVRIEGLRMWVRSANPKNIS